MAKGQPRRFLTEEQRQAFVGEYLAGDSLNRIASRHGVSLYSVWKTLILRDIPRRPTGVVRPCVLNEAAFDNAESNPTAAYFAGLLFADGCIHRGSRWGQATVCIGQSSEDGILVHRLREFLGTDRKLHIAVPQSGYPTESTKTTLCVASDRLAVALERYGVSERKSLTAAVPDCMAFNRDWWRGVIDGDGWVTISEAGCPIVGVVGTRQTCEAYMAFVRTLTPTKAKATPLSSIWQSKATESNAYRVALAVYSSCCVAMPRKLATAERIIVLGVSKGWPTDAQSKPRRG